MNPYSLTEAMTDNPQCRGRACPLVAGLARAGRSRASGGPTVYTFHRLHLFTLFGEISEKETSLKGNSLCGVTAVVDIA
ncbi:hypothetical protein CRUP_008221 [Coryphaenoides rupestris]|nr:hypothetical protein CRUP_008221 [Coryphaenoides rupestris]